MNKASHLEKRPVSSGEIYRYNGCLTGAHQTRHRGFPGRISDNALASLPVGYFAGRKHADCTTLRQEAQGLPKRTEIGVWGVWTFKWIDENKIILRFRNAFEQVVCHHLGIRPHRTEQGSENNAFNAAKGMVSYHHDRSRGWQTCYVTFQDVVANVERCQDGFKKGMAVAACSSQGFPVKLIKLVKQKPTFEQAFDGGKHPLPQRVAKRCWELENTTGHRRAQSSFGRADGIAYPLFVTPV
jgi:hypothetical protein